jgi:hypothetical protein
MIEERKTVRLSPMGALYTKIGLTKPLYMTYIPPTDAPNRDSFLVSLLACVLQKWSSFSRDRNDSKTSGVEEARRGAERAAARREVVPWHNTEGGSEAEGLHEARVAARARWWRRATRGRRHRKIDLRLEFNLPLFTVHNPKKRIGL